MEGDRLWLQANQTPLAEVLDQFSRVGVEVRLDPEVQSTITGAIRGQDIDAALEALLEGYDYLLTWKMLRGPLGRVPKLKEIQVFLPGHAAAARPRPKKSAKFEVTRGVGGAAPEFVKDELLAGVRPGTTYAQFQSLLDQIGGMIVEADAATGVYLIRFPAGTNVEALLAQLTRNPLVAHAELNLVTRLPAGFAAGRGPLPPVSPPADGSIPVAVLDSGLDPAAGLGPLVSAGWDAVAPERALADPDGHGTQMAILAAGLLAADGLAPADAAVALVSVRAFDEDGKTSNFAILQALAYAAQAGAKVVNMSWGSGTDSEFLRAAVQTAAAQGLILVAAAGNEPTGQPVYPAAYPDVIAVGGVTANGQPWANSNVGAFVDLSASVAATLPSGSYVGTSISSAAVANALAQYLNRHPGSTAAQVRAALAAALSPAPAAGTGAGVLDAAALRRLLDP
ncbi:MAG: S8 family serine peptidase [Kiritimatiellia bacterium]